MGKNNNVIIFGRGSCYENYKKYLNKFNIIGFTDNSVSNETFFGDKKVYKVDELNKLDFDKIIIASSFFEQIKQQLCSEFNILEDNILDIREIKYPYILKVNELNLNVTCLEEEYIVDDIFFRKTYDFLSNWNDIIVIDIGMNVGYASLFFASKKNVEKVYAYEPFENTFNIAKNNFKINDEYISNKIHCYNYGVGDRDYIGESLYDTQLKGCMSTVYDWKEINNVIDTNKLKLSFEVKSVENIIKPIIDKYKSTNKIILKLDCEGSEYCIIDELEKNKLLCEIDSIILEYHYKGSEKISSTLIENEFIVFNSVDDKEHNTGILRAVRFGHDN